jgi:large subunit ribosomal protein L28
MAGLLTKTTSSITAAFRGLSLTSNRAFSTTLPSQKTRQLPEYIPPYPHGPNYLYKQSNSGLYGGVSIQFGNKISKGKNKGKTRRSWKPNVRRKKLHSDALNEDVFIKVTRKALRTIYKSGGLDNYLLDDRPGRIKELGVFGWELRWRIMQTPKIQERFRKERKALGIPDPPSFEEWVKQKEQEIKESVEKDIDIKDRTKPTISAVPRSGPPGEAARQ